jgi:nitroreductase
MNAFAAIWCCIENILLAATAEGLACALRVPFAEESEYVAEYVHAPQDYVMPCYISIGHPTADAVVVEQEKVNIEDKMHFGSWR